MRRTLTRRILEPIERVSEVLFGLIMVLTFTGSLSAAEAGRADVRAMLIAALGCNLAWGIIDAVMYLMGCLADGGRDCRPFARCARRPTRGRPVRCWPIRCPTTWPRSLRPEELDAWGVRLRAGREPPAAARLGRDEWLGALGVFLWVFASTFPVVVPFLFVSEPQRAVRLSNTVALVMLYLTGHALGRVTGHRTWLTGLAMVAVGALLVALTIGLGG